MTEVINNWCWIDCANMTYSQGKWQEFIWAVGCAVVAAVATTLYQRWKYR